jgi:hypothetical protein
MPKAASGELRKLTNGFAARITLRGRARRDFVLATCETEPEAVERCRALAAMAARLRRSVEPMMHGGPSATRAHVGVHRGRGGRSLRRPDDRGRR